MDLAIKNRDFRGDVVYDPLAKMSKSMYGKESNVMVTNQNKAKVTVV